MRENPLIITLVVSAVIFISTIFFVYILVGDQPKSSSPEPTPVVTSTPVPQEGSDLNCPEWVNCMPGPDFTGCEIPEGCEGITEKVY